MPKMSSNSTKLYYERNAVDYFRQTHARDLEEYWTILERHIKPGSLILDLGCGSGRDMKRFAGQGFCPIGVDYARPLLKLAVAYSGQPAVLGDFRMLPFASSSFDAAWAMASLLHIPRNAIGRTLEQFARVLKPEASLFTAVKLGKGEEIDSLGRLNVYYSLEHWLATLERAGFAIEDLHVSNERRPLADGTSKEIPWIASLAVVGGPSTTRSVRQLS
jgi:SAM-dependent methyltransferase